MKKFRNKYRIPSARLQNWDYGNNGAYFITICTEKMQCLFGDIVSDKPVETRFIASLKDANDINCEMQLNELGKIAYDIWEEIPTKFPFVELGNFVIMPNHMHGILIINKIKLSIDGNGNAIGNEHVETRLIASKVDAEVGDVATQLIASVVDVEINDVETRLIASVHGNDDDQHKGGFAGNNNPMFHENISRIIRWYKGRCSFEMRKIHADFNWQFRFYDHIIRDSKSFDNVQNYIEDNPSKWVKDKFHK